MSWPVAVVAATANKCLHQHLKRDGYVIYAGQGHLAADVCRIANMGDIRESDLDRLFGSLRKALA